MPEALSVKTFQRRDTIPARPDTLWWLKQGAVKVVTCNERGTAITLGYWGKDDVVGQPLSQVNPYEIHCLTLVKAACVPCHRSNWLSQPIRRHLQQTEQLLYLIRSDPISLRLLNILLWLSQRFGHNTERGRYIDLRLTHQDIADIVGATRVTITRLLNQFERQGMISRLDGYILILPPALAKLNAYS